MSDLPFDQRFDEFQTEAVENIVNDYREKLEGRYLLVIPTGGGKTYTAVRAINELFRLGILDTDSDLVMWAVHRKELVTQAIGAFDAFERTSPGRSFRDQVTVLMISGATDYLRKHDDVKLVVIDEAHHAAMTNVQYGPIFDYPTLGILGLTATPSRHDGRPLEFEKETYSIGFPDLVEKRIILSPEIREIEGGRFSGVTAMRNGFSGLEDLSTEERDKRIIQHIVRFSRDYTKIIVYASSALHAVQLYEYMKRSQLTDLYEAIDYITGEARSGDEERVDFIRRIKSYERAVIVNHDVLSEGYDDPKVNTVVMARPSRSKLVYMQAIGRAIRVDSSNLAKTAYIVEVVDDLPNIRYRIDNRWLFSDISDALEPAVRDEFFDSAGAFRNKLKGIYEQFAVPIEQQRVPEWDKSVRYSLLLFRYYSGPSQYRHIPILIDNHNRPKVSNWYNFLSERMESYRKTEINPEQGMLNASYGAIDALDKEVNRRLIYDAMEDASKVASSDVSPDDHGTSWITFVALRYRQSEIDDNISKFISEMINREHVKNEIKDHSYQTGDYLIRFPLPLSSYIGQIVSKAEFNKIRAIIDGLRELKDSQGDEDHRKSVHDLLDQSTLPVDMIYRNSLPEIVRESKNYYLELE